jgi:hypothetical protein
LLAIDVAGDGCQIVLDPLKAAVVLAALRDLNRKNDFIYLYNDVPPSSDEPELMFKQVQFSFKVDPTKLIDNKPAYVCVLDCIFNALSLTPPEHIYAIYKALAQEWTRYCGVEPVLEFFKQVCDPKIVADQKKAIESEQIDVNEVIDMGMELRRLPRFNKYGGLTIGKYCCETKMSSDVMQLAGAILPEHSKRLKNLVGQQAEGSEARMELIRIQNEIDRLLDNVRREYAAFRSSARAVTPAFSAVTAPIAAAADQPQRQQSEPGKDEAPDPKPTASSPKQ